MLEFLGDWLGQIGVGRGVATFAMFSSERLSFGDVRLFF